MEEPRCLLPAVVVAVAQEAHHTLEAVAAVHHIAPRAEAAEGLGVRVAAAHRYTVAPGLERAVAAVAEPVKQGRLAGIP